jgi:hypothetical protein
MWWAIGKAIAYMIVSYAISASMQPKPERPKEGKLEVPIADEGSPVPVVFGTVIIKKSNVLWYGDPSTTPIYSTGGKK